MTYAALAKYASWTLYIALTILAIWWGVHNIYKNGVDYAKSQCIAEKAKREAELADELGKAMQRMADQKAGELKHLTEVISEKETKYAALAKRFADDRSGLYIPAQAKTCDNRVPTASNTEQEPGTEERQRLPEQIERDLRSLVYEAQRDVIDYNSLLEKCSRGATIIP